MPTRTCSFTSPGAEHVNAILYVPSLRSSTEQLEADEPKAFASIRHPPLLSLLPYRSMVVRYTAHAELTTGAASVSRRSVHLATLRLSPGVSPNGVNAERMLP